MATDSPYNDARQRRILEIARRAVDAAVHRRKLTPVVADDEPFLLERRGCFVTLRRRGDGELRGCIGTFDNASPLIENLVNMAGAATRDPRFVMDPVTVDELDRLRIDVSILTPMQPIDDPLKMRIGIDGIYIVADAPRGRQTGCFLPEVAAEQGWDAPTTLSMCCAHKMALHPESWKPPTELKFFVFQSSMIAEPHE